MKHTWKAALAVATLATFAGAARADLALDGQTGLFSNPTAEIVSKQGPEIAGQLVHYKNGYSPANSYNIFGIQGAIQAADKLELSAGYDYYKENNGDTGNWWHIGGKYQLLTQSEKGFDLAVGADYGRFSWAGGYRDNDYMAYVAATKAFAKGNGRAPIKGTVGLRWNKNTTNDGTGSNKSSVYGGVEVPLTNTGKVSLIGELGSKRYDDGNTVWDVGVRYHPENSGLSFGVGLGNPWGYTGTTWFAQVGYQFGK